MSSTTIKFAVVICDAKKGQEVKITHDSFKAVNIMCDVLIDKMKTVSFNDFCEAKKDIDELSKLLAGNQKDLTAEFYANKINFILLNHEIEVFVHEVVCDKDSTPSNATTTTELSEKLKFLVAGCSPLEEVMQRLKTLEEENKQLKAKLEPKTKSKVVKKVK